MAIGKHATTIAPDDQGRLVVTYYATQIVVCDGVKKTVKLDFGGYVTATTVKRMNEALQEFGIEAKVYRRGGEMKIKVRGIELQLHDGMTLDYSDNFAAVVKYERVAQ